MWSVMPFSEGKSMEEHHPQNIPPFFPSTAPCVAGKGAHGAHWASMNVKRLEDRLLQVSRSLATTLPKRHSHLVLKSSVESKKQAGSGQGRSTPKNTWFWVKYLGNWRDFSLLRTWFTRERHLDLLACDQGFITSLDNHEERLSLRQKSSLLPSENLRLHWARCLHPQHSKF